MRINVILYFCTLIVTFVIVHSLLKIMLINKIGTYVLFLSDKAPNKILDIVFGYSIHYICTEQWKGHVQVT